MMRCVGALDRSRGRPWIPREWEKALDSHVATGSADGAAQRPGAILEREFAEQSYGFRPGRSGMTRCPVTTLSARLPLCGGRDIPSISRHPQERLWRGSGERGGDGRVLALIEQYLHRRCHGLDKWTRNSTPQCRDKPVLANPTNPGTRITRAIG